MKTGVIIGRFQVPELTEGHKSLIDQVSAENDRIFILIGRGGAEGTTRYPLHWLTIGEMLSEYVHSLGKKLVVQFVKDHVSDEYWSSRVDSRIENCLYHPKLNPMSEEDKITLYGGRDSFIPYYSGRFKTKELTTTQSPSGTELRRNVGIPYSKEGRKGAIWATNSRWPTMYQVVDAIIINSDNEILLCRKEGMEEWGVIGGFVDPSDEDLITAVKREVREETGLEINPKYSFSMKYDDSRYRRTPDGVMSHVFLCTLAGNCGVPKAEDDIVEAKWFGFGELPKLIPHHAKMINRTRGKER